MEEFKNDFLLNCSKFTNCQIICSDGVLHTHKLLLAASGSFIFHLLEDVPVCEDVSLLLVDFKIEHITMYLDQTIFRNLRSTQTMETKQIENIFKSKPPELGKIRKESKTSVKQNRESSSNKNQWDSGNDFSDDYEDSQDAHYDSEIDSKFTVKMEHDDQEEKEPKNKSKKKLVPQTKSSYPARNEVNIEELSKQIIPNPLTPAQVKKNEWIEKQIRHEKAVLAYLG